ncbi:ErfK/YbiS/YcfS/YnhG [Novosphingobium nitrogenifigens DSM 19370]|uniref:ErfK/YbiS/YcfS/YnhG n=1 Tax=Novosphingobium nitrogenifigens DSM 19370 TaxID=983920 RepID=F1Z7K9_9SPHN|nr:L,D-transpeptidase family protein [Novosphingobium nitrogenifigens]EGD59400.1 ErfK/YbiS/YcfS/YnhG [Novosphingobium nitrogenifigens DSM 19370]
MIDWWRKRLKGREGFVVVGLVALGMGGMLFLDVARDAIGVLSSPARSAPSATTSDTVPPANATPKPPPTRAPSSTPGGPFREDPFVVRSILPIDGPIRFGQYYWDESKGEPGPLVITVDLAARVLSVFENGHEVGATAILKGYGDKPTPIGVFPITQKDAHHVSNLYDAPMPWMMRLTNDGVSIHGSKVERGYATNGCIGVPDAFAEKLFRLAKVGDKVIITDGKHLNLGDPIIASSAPGPRP